jgi:hypothetical protein
MRFRQDLAEQRIHRRMLAGRVPLDQHLSAAAAEGRNHDAGEAEHVDARMRHDAVTRQLQSD